MNIKIGTSKILLVVVVVLLLILPVFTFYLGSNYQKNIKVKDSPVKKDLISKKYIDEKYLIASGSAEYAVVKATAIKELKEKIKEVYYGRVTFKPDEWQKLDTYNWSTRIPYLLIRPPINKVSEPTVDANSFDISIYVYKYIPGQKVENGYEGATWTVDMDKWVRLLTSANASTKKAVIIDMGLPSEAEEPIDVRNWAGKKFIVYDSGFRPSGTISREYVNYNVTRKEIINIILSMRDDLSVNKPAEYIPDHTKLWDYPPFESDFISSVEDAIVSTISQL